MPTQHQFDKVVESYKKFKKNLPKTIGQEAVNFAKENFRRQGFLEPPLKSWKRRNPRAARNKGRAILVDTGRLKRSIRITRTLRDQVHIASNVEYAAIHNFGGQVKGRARVRSHMRRTRSGRSRVRSHTRNVNFRMPRRQFIGPSSALHRQINRMIRLQLLKVFKT